MLLIFEDGGYASRPISSLMSAQVSIEVSNFFALDKLIEIWLAGPALEIPDPDKRIVVAAFDRSLSADRNRLDRFLVV